ncbi:MAG: hypothetical protein ACFFBD_12840 [Candidatus Hodarchaeota archaeon]
MPLNVRKYSYLNVAVDLPNIVLRIPQFCNQSLLREPPRVDSSPSTFLANPTASRQCLVQSLPTFISLKISHD